MASNPMNSERARLETFDQRFAWFSAFLTREDLARNGLYSTGNNYETECNWCKTRCEDWHQAHNSIRGHSFSCSFLLNPELCGNIPLNRSDTDAQQVQTTETSKKATDLYVESNRLVTFKNWPNPNIMPESLAKAGFYYLNRSDEVQCAWCKGIIAKWEKQDNAFEEHKRFFPDCPRVQLGPLIEFDKSEIKDLGIQKPTPPKQPKYATIDARLRTFVKWPIHHIQKPEALAQAGLYYQEIDDNVRCFHCSIGLRSWQKYDDPWFEHAKWYPQCQFVLLAKGYNYVQQVQELVNKNGGQAQAIVTMTIDDAMNLPPARDALAIGIDGGTVRNAVQQRLQIIGSPYDNLDDLLKAIFDSENEERSDIDDAASCSTNCIQNVNYIKSSLMSNHTPYTNINAVGNNRSNAAEVNELSSTEASTSKKLLEKDLSNISVSNEPIASKAQILEEENRKLKDARLCKVCLDEEVEVLFLPCGHLVTCLQCAPGIKQCPMCRSEINALVRTFMS